jgi:hypothetical protein
MTQSEHVN